MSLRDFHIVFIIAAILCSLSFGYWAWQQYIQDGSPVYFITAVACGIIAVGLTIYEIGFVRKTKNGMTR